jgi:hypothetical protein
VTTEQLPKIPEEIKQLARWWADQIQERAAGAVDAAAVVRFSATLADLLSDGLAEPFSVSIGYRDILPDVLVRAARKSKLGALKPYLQPLLFSRAQPGEVYVQIGDRTSCSNIFTP